MTSGEHGAPPEQPQLLAGAWPAGLFLGAVTVILGLVLAFEPTASLNVIAVWFIVIGISEILGGFLLRRALRATERAPDPARV